jgi:N-acetylglucosaminyldiphosphoundecaprenol N-acetyl-beta-D-mannosaminyltransferase
VKSATSQDPDDVGVGPAGFRSLTLGRLRVDAVTQAEALRCIADLIDSGRGGRVFTPNIDHVVMADSDARFRAAYSRAALSLADGFPIVATSKLTRVRLPQKVSGSDLVEPLMQQAAARGDRVFFYGGMDGVAELARDKLVALYPKLQVVGCASPHVTLDPTPDQLAALLAPLRETKPTLILVALGAPKQELFIDLVADQLAPAVLLGIGASLDFVAGRVQRAPKWMADNGLEWLYRLNQERGRLWRRYLRDTQYPLIVAKHALKTRMNRRGPSL